MFGRAILWTLNLEEEILGHLLVRNFEIVIGISARILQLCLEVCKNSGIVFGNIMQEFGSSVRKCKKLEIVLILRMERHQETTLCVNYYVT